jgi:ketosteroid isomerase-like protein
MSAEKNVQTVKDFFAAIDRRDREGRSWSAWVSPRLQDRANG